ncbi:hypothetical protein [Bradyrhizobium sp. BR13661]|jgi:hypothetical protein|uniref:hypothetical protein n=1 Tax=Bradyrhizobium sp. BR13661 TaxID=2940622 RepID=UPI0024731932|nr:hypothetical protein [Bradyrhizobium sp. BR13661]MDH6259150.1 hypothetical protein [Bradyrhizobium sp. BR13661]
MTDKITEAEFMQSLIPQLRSEGYEVYLRPTAPVAPPFLADLRPDAIAIGKGKKLIIELVTSESSNQKKAQGLANLIKEHPDWELRVFVVTSAGRTDELQVQSREQIQSVLDEIKLLQDTNHLSAAFMLGWATFEAIARRLMTTTFVKPQTPGRLVQQLAQEGYVTPSEGDFLRILAAKRNALIHGNLHDLPQMGEVEFFRKISERLAAQS